MKMQSCSFWVVEDTNAIVHSREHHHNISVFLRKRYRINRFTSSTRSQVYKLRCD